MIKVAPEALAEAEGLDLAMAVADDLRLCLESSLQSCLWLLSSELGQWSQASNAPAMSAQAGNRGRSCRSEAHPLGAAFAATIGHRGPPAHAAKLPPWRRLWSSDADTRAARCLQRSWRGRHRSSAA